MGRPCRAVGLHGRLRPGSGDREENAGSQRHGSQVGRPARPQRQSGDVACAGNGLTERLRRQGERSPRQSTVGRLEQRGNRYHQPSGALRRRRHDQI